MLHIIKMNNPYFYFLRFTKMPRYGMIPYKAIIFPDKQLYRVRCGLQIYSDKIGSEEKISDTILKTRIYPFFERQYDLTGKILFDQRNKRLLLNDINSCAHDHLLHYSEISVLPEPNGDLNGPSWDNHLLLRDYIRDMMLN
jgi:hypothetical protein